MNRNRKRWQVSFPFGALVFLVASCGGETQQLAPVNSSQQSDNRETIDSTAHFFATLAEMTTTDTDADDDTDASAANAGSLTLSPAKIYKNLISSTGNRLCDLQADIAYDNAKNGNPDTDPNDGGWDWEIMLGQNGHLSPPSPENTYGATALGLWAAQRTKAKSTRFTIALNDVFQSMKNRPEVDSPPDFAFLVLLASHLGSHQKKIAHNLARQRYEAKLQQFGGAQGIVDYVVNARLASNSAALIPYDLGYMILSAHALDYVYSLQKYRDDARIYGKAVADGLSQGGFFDIKDEQQNFYTEGLAWAAFSLVWGEADRTLLNKIGAQLFFIQLADGSWSWNSNYPAGDTETTALVIQAIALTAQQLPSESSGLDLLMQAARQGSDWLAAQQLATKGFADDQGFENTLVAGEALLSFLLVPPSPSTSVYPFPLKASSISRLGSQPPIAHPVSLPIAF